MRTSVLCLLTLWILPGQSQALSLVSVGDSITEGLLSPPVGPSYPDILADVYDVTNVGCGGTSSQDWSPTASSSLPSCGAVAFSALYSDSVLPLMPVDVVTVLLGTNDAIGFFEPTAISIENYQSNMESLVLALLLDGAGQVILLAPPAFPSGGPVEAAYITGYRNAIRELCEPPGDDILCGPDLGELLDSSDDYFAAGSFHPNGPAHALIASELIALVPEASGMLLGIAGLSCVGLLARRRRVH